ncbi:MAG: hypothetical protein M3M97_02555 [Actinomycetota bacterium]|nr:hypothetical protein [Actinomycetota bacterium]
MNAENSLYPPPDVGRLEGLHEAVFVYLSVEKLPSGEDMEVRVQRVESGCVYTLFFRRGVGIEVLDEQEDQLSKGENEVTGIVKVALETRSDERVPPGNYTVEVCDPGSSGERDEVAARKFFIVGSNLGPSLRFSVPFGGAEASRRRFIGYNVLRSERVLRNEL